MAKEKQENELEITNESDNPIDVKVEKVEEDLVSDQTIRLSSSNLINAFESEQLKKRITRNICWRHSQGWSKNYRR